MHLRKGQKQVTMDPNQARDKEVIAYFQQAVQPKDRLPESKCPSCPKSEKKTLDGRAQPPDLGGRRQKKNDPAVKIHPGKFERGPQNFFPIGHYNSRNFGNFPPPPFGAGNRTPASKKKLSGCNKYILENLRTALKNFYRWQADWAL